MIRTSTIAAWMVVGGLAWLAWPSASRACSCLPPKPPTLAARDADAVFEAVAGHPIPSGSEFRYTFTVARVFRGNVPPRVDVYTATSSAACGRRFDPNESYLVYASRRSDGNLQDGLCSRTRPLDQAEEDLVALAGITVPGREEPQDLDESPTSEPPRIDTAANGPPAHEPPAAKRGCTAGEMPHGAAWVWVGLLAVGIAATRVRTSRNLY
jgi:hypothetical protein